MDQRPRRAGTYLPLVEEAKHQSLHRLLNKLLFSLHYVGEVDVGRFAPQLDSAGDNIFRRAGENMPPDRRGASERQLGDTLAGGQRLARLFAESLYHVKHPGREQIADQLQ